jgi:hypothetical protein
MAEKTLRERLSPEQRALPLIHTIDPGFVHHRRIEAIIVPAAMKHVDQAIKELPELPDWQRRVRIDHIYTRVMLDWCRVNEVKTLGAVIASGEGRIFCSTERLGPCPDFYELERATQCTGTKIIFSSFFPSRCSLVSRGDRRNIGPKGMKALVRIRAGQNLLLPFSLFEASLIVEVCRWQRI